MGPSKLSDVASADCVVDTDGVDDEDLDELTDRVAAFKLTSSKSALAPPINDLPSDDPSETASQSTSALIKSRPTPSSRNMVHTTGCKSDFLRRRAMVFALRSRLQRLSLGTAYTHLFKYSRMILATLRAPVLSTKVIFAFALWGCFFIGRSFN